MSKLSDNFFVKLDNSDVDWEAGDRQGGDEVSGVHTRRTHAPVPGGERYGGGVHSSKYSQQSALL